MTAVPDKQAVRESFSKAADSYDSWAEHHRAIAKRLCEFLPPRQAINSILELGCGTGILTGRLRQRYAGAKITAIDIAPGMVQRCRRRFSHDPAIRFLVADAEGFRPDAPYDLIASSCSLQWFTDRRGSIRRLRTMVAPGGSVVIAVLVQGTLPELTGSYLAATGSTMPGLDYWDADRYIMLLQSAGLVVTRSEVEPVRVTYRDPLEVLRAMRGIGATLTGEAKAPPLPASKIRRLLAYYRSHFVDTAGRAVCTYRVLYLTGKD